MTAKGLILSVSEMEVFVSKGPIVTDCKIGISLLAKKGKERGIVYLPYDPYSLSYVFDISEIRPGAVNDYDFSIFVVNQNGETIDNATVRSSSGSVDTIIKGAAKKVIHDFVTVAKTLNGSKISIFKKMSVQEKCPVCWDYDMESSRDSGCKVCGGTGTVNRYSNPVFTYCSAIQSTQSKKSLAQEGMEINYGNVTTSLPATIMLETGDIVYHYALGDWFIVDTNIETSSLQNVNTLQTVGLEELPTHAPEIETISSMSSFVKTNRRR